MTWHGDRMMRYRENMQQYIWAMLHDQENGKGPKGPEKKEGRIALIAL
jgi:hypothetical protein